MKLVLDHHFSPLLAHRMRDLGHDVVTAAEQSWHRDSDEALLSHATEDGRALVTADVKDLVPIARRWAEQGRPHAGVVLAPASSVPRTQAGVGQAVRVLVALLDSHPATDALGDRVHWL